jgi:hypothetical protein
VYVIGNSTGSQIDILISESGVTPGLPSGYTLYRQIGNYTTDSNNNIDNISYYGVDALSNKSPNASINSVMPDYASTRTYNKNTTYTTTKPGYLFTHNTSTTDDGETRVYITYNGVTREFSSQSSSEDTDYTYDTMTFPLPIGAKFRVTSRGNMNIWYFECIGA